MGAVTSGVGFRPPAPSVLLFACTLLPPHPISPPCGSIGTENRSLPCTRTIRATTHVLPRARMHPCPHIVPKNKRLEHAALEKRILRVLDHMFVPTLCSGFDIAPRFSCIVVVLCLVGGLHSLRHRMPKHCFPLPSASL